MNGWDRLRMFPMHSLVPLDLLANEGKERESESTVRAEATILELDEHTTDPGIGAADAACVFHLHGTDPDSED